MLKKRLRIDAAGRAWRGREALPLRPKARLLLAALRAEPGRIMDRETLCRAVWGHEHVEPQALFQLVSEIRSATGERDCIVTYPNRGYAWSGPLRRSPMTGRVAAATACAIVMTVAGLFAALPKKPSTQPVVAMPALSAFEDGLSHRTAGRNEAAIASLRLAVSEYPRFGLAKLELARSLAAVGSTREAQGFAHDALSDARIADDAYLAASANLLLSHLSWLAGDFLRASTLGRTASDIANEAGFICVAEESERWNRRLAAALAEPQPLAIDPPDQRLAHCRRAHDGVPDAWQPPESLFSETVG